LIVLPDGASAKDYADLQAVDRAGLMWEWLRRDPGYGAWYVKASAATRGDAVPALRWRLMVAEDPGLGARRARLFWSADADPGALRVMARPVGLGPAGLPIHRLSRFLSVVRGDGGREYAVLSDGRHHLRLDVEEGTLENGRVALHVLLDGLRDAEAKLETLRRLAVLCRQRRFPPEHFSFDSQRERSLILLRVADALGAGASQRELAEFLFGMERARSGWQGRSDSLRSRVRRLAAEARRLAAGGYRNLLRSPWENV